MLRHAEGLIPITFCNRERNCQLNLSENRSSKERVNTDLRRLSNLLSSAFSHQDLGIMNYVKTTANRVNLFWALSSTVDEFESK